ncbi:hypothetical protein [Microbacterium lacus]|uniref:hypothetical protein n=1 Tax=Microbacterium lacus TaxID=415217 RepID=UPI000C2C82B1|nr:hypothetical protein [Microbacterium lacus]
MDCFCFIYALWCHATKDVTAGSWAEWVTAFIAALALAAAVVAGFYAASSAKSTRDAAQSAKDSAEIAVDAFLSDAKVRIEAQARKVYTTTGVPRYQYAKQPAPSETNIIYSSDLREPSTAPEYRGKPPAGAWQYTANALQLEFVVHNSSDEIVGPVQLFATDVHRGEKTPVGVPTEVILPAKEQKVFVVVPLLPGTNLQETDPELVALRWVPVLRFRDTAGIHWERTGFEPIHQMDYDPFSPDAPPHM